MRILLLFLMLVPMLSGARNKNLYDFTVTNIDGKQVKLSTFKGKKVLIVNVASKCGLTPQYKELQELYDQYGKGNFVIVAFPANDFMQQEPGSNSDIKEFCSANYNVSFPLMSKVEVTGSNMAPLYKWLTSKNLNGVQDAPVTWNFQKFMISEKGEWLGVVAPKESPTCPKIVNWLKD